MMARPHFRVIKGAPTAFFGLLAIGIGIAIGISWFAMDWRYRAQIEKKDATIEFLEQQAARESLI